MRSAPVLASSVDDLRQFLAATIAGAGFALDPIRISDQDQWGYSGGALSHRPGGFFDVCGFRHMQTGSEELALFQPQGALTGLAICTIDGLPHVLLQARIEPGNTGVGQYGPTIQSTPANYLRLHGGKQTPYLELFSTHQPGVSHLATSMQLDLGRRYFQKSKTHTYVALPTPINPAASTLWVPLPVLAETVAFDNFLNADLRSLLSVFDWEWFVGRDAGGVPDRAADLHARLAAPDGYGADEWRTVPLHSLQRWEVTDQGISDIDETGISVGLYRTSSTTREVSTWVQPLLRATDLGLVRLLRRQAGREAELLVSVKSEFGISGQRTLLPTDVAYPGQDHPRPPAPAGGRIAAAFMQSDEGGRFYCHESRYELVDVGADVPAGEDQFWVGQSTLKRLLATSNTVSFQLRCAASLLVPSMNPRACSAR